MDITIKEGVPGLKEARMVEAAIHKVGIQDIQLLFDEQLRMWAVVQVQKKAKSLILLPKSYNETDIKPYLLWWCKNEKGAYRSPNDIDVTDIIAVVTRAHAHFADGGKTLNEGLERQDAEKQQAHEKKFHDRIHAIAPAMKKAIREELG